MNPHQKNFTVFVCCLLVLAITVGHVFTQGELDPAAAPKPTMKTLSQIEPRTDLSVLYDQNHDGIGDNTQFEIVINKPGSYYLSSNLSVTRPHGIRVATTGATIDLNGFQIDRKSGTGGTAITLTPDSHRTAVRNGTIHGFAIGIGSLSAAGRFARGGRFRDLAVSGCTQYGIWGGEASIIDSCTACDNGDSGPFFAIRGEAGSVIRNCTAAQNTTSQSHADMISGGIGSCLVSCSVTNNSGTDSFSCISGGKGSSINGCASAGNVAEEGPSHNVFGIFARTGSSVTGCAASQNTGGQAGAGIYADGSAVVACAASEISGRNHVGFGIIGIDGTLVSNCTTTENDGSGISLEGGSGSAAIDSTSSSNYRHGVWASIGEGALIRGNNLYGNGDGGTGAAIELHQSNTRIEENHLVGSDFGINATTSSVSRNVIVRNSASENTGTPDQGPNANYDFDPTNNPHGIIHDISALPNGEIPSDHMNRNWHW